MSQFFFVWFWYILFLLPRGILVLLTHLTKKFSIRMFINNPLTEKSCYDIDYIINLCVSNSKM